MGLSLGFGMWRGDCVTLECQCVAGIGIGEDGADLANCLFRQPIGCDGTADAIVPDMIGDNSTLATAINRPNYCPVEFF